MNTVQDDLTSRSRWDRRYLPIESFRSHWPGRQTSDQDA